MTIFERLSSLFIGQTRRNIFSNYWGQFFAVIIPLLALPYYLSMLGTLNWGLVSLSILIQSLMSLFGVGMNQAIVREAALLHGDTTKHRENLAGLLLGLEYIYWPVGVAITFFVMILSPWLALILISDTSSNVEGVNIIILASLMFVAQFAATPYKAILYSTEKQVQSNFIMTGWLILRHASALIASEIYGTAIAYLITTILCMVFELLTFRYQTWALMFVNKKNIRTDAASIKSILRTTGPLTLSVVISLSAMQIDKWAVATMLTTETLGMYTIAATLGLGVLNLFAPIANAYQPVIIQRVSTSKSLHSLNIKLLKLFFLGSLTILSVYSICGEYLLHVWLRNSVFAESIFPVLGVLLFGSCLNAMYNNWLANGETRKILRANLLSLTIVVLVVPICTRQFGMVGAAIGWLLTNSVCFILSLDWLKYRRPNA